MHNVCLSFVSRLHMSIHRETVDPSWFYIFQSLMFRHDEKLIFFMVLQNKTKNDGCIIEHYFKVLYIP